MPTLDAFLAQVAELCTASRVSEQKFRLSVDGDALDVSLAARLQSIRRSALSLGIAVPSVLIGGQNVDDDDLDDAQYGIGRPWRMVIGKPSELTNRLRAREIETTVLFFSVAGFSAWLSSLDPFARGSTDTLDLSEATTIRVVGLDKPFGGPLLWILPLNCAIQADDIPSTALPTSSEVHSLIHVNADKLMSVCPRGWSLNWGELKQAAATPIIRLSAVVLSACLVNEIKCFESRIDATLRGTKLVSLPLTKEITAGDLGGLIPVLIETVEWVYEQRAETRLKLITDRLSIDVQPGQSLIDAMHSYLAEALKQARDSYSFVILERKDAYHKEMRELMKDMKAQADLYAAKVRDLVSCLTRDFLGILVFIGFSFVGKFDQKNLHSLLSSNELSLLLKFLSSYLLLSFILQVSTQLRDAHLSYKECCAWLSVLKNYTSKSDNENQFLEPIAQRRLTFFLAMWICGTLYSFAALVVWNLPFVIQLLLGQ